MAVTSVDVGNGVRLNKLGIIYGANASGKSNILYAMQNVFDILFFSRTKKNEGVLGEGPFALKKDEPTTLFVSFYANQIRYDYLVSYYPTYILKEEFYYYPNNSKALFYERRYTSDDTQADVRFGKSLEMSTKTQDAIIQNTLNNHSVFSTFDKVALGEDAKKIATLYNWIGMHVHEVDGDYVQSFTKQMEGVVNDEKKKKSYLHLLKKADFNILDFSYFQEERLIREDSKVKVKHEEVQFLNASENGQFMLDHDNQSKGTRRYLMILNFLYDMVTGSHIYMLDELGVELHYDLLLYFLNIFLYNSNDSQLVFTSQEISLLKEDFLDENRSLVWFAEKSSQTASAKYTRADQFGLHKNLSLYRSYRIGKLGAVPALGSFFLDLDDIKE